MRCRLFFQDCVAQCADIGHMNLDNVARLQIREGRRGCVDAWNEVLRFRVAAIALRCSYASSVLERQLRIGTTAAMGHRHARSDAGRDDRVTRYRARTHAGGRLRYRHQRNLLGAARLRGHWRRHLAARRGECAREVPWALPLRDSRLLERGAPGRAVPIRVRPRLFPLNYYEGRARNARPEWSRSRVGAVTVVVPWRRDAVRCDVRSSRLRLAFSS